MAVAEDHPPRGGLLRDHDFRHLWAADAISQVGTRVSALAVPLLALLTLEASDFEVAALRTAQTVAYLMIGLQAGAWCDRMRNRPVLIVADLARAAALGSVPVAAAFGVLTIWQLYAVVLVSGLFTVFFDVAHQSYLPRLVRRADLVEGNAKLRANMSVASLAAPSISGWLVQFFSAPVAIAVDACSYLWSAAWLSRIRKREESPPPREDRNLWREIREGWGVVLGHPVLRAISVNNALSSLCQSAQLSIIVVFLVREVQLSAGVIGLLNSLALVGALLGSFLVRRLTTRFGAARLLWSTSMIVGVAYLSYPLTTPGWGLAWYVAANFVSSTCVIITIVVQVSFQQALCPADMLGRVNATMNFLYWGVAPLGSLGAGLSAGTISARGTLWVAAAGMVLAGLALVLSPLRTMRDLPDITGH